MMSTVQILCSAEGWALNDANLFPSLRCMVCSRSLIRYLLSSPYVSLQEMWSGWPWSFCLFGTPALPSHIPPLLCTPERCLVLSTACPQAEQGTFAPRLRLKQCKEGMTQVISPYRSAVTSTGEVTSSSSSPQAPPQVLQGEEGAWTQLVPGFNKTSWPLQQKTCLELPQGVARNGTSGGKRPRGSAD